MTGNADVGVLVPSHDPYADCWEAFFTLLFRYWPDCPYPVYLGSNHQTVDHPRVEPILVGDDASWGDSVLAMLDALSHEVVLILLEDYFLMEPVDTGHVRRLVQLLRDHDAAVVYLRPSPRTTDTLEGDPTVGVLPPGTPYRASMQGGLWHSDALQELVEPGESAWEFELKGSARTDTMDRPFLSLVAGADWPVHYMRSGVDKGKWKRKALDHFEREGLEVDTSARPVWTRLDTAVHRTRIMLARARDALLGPPDRAVDRSAEETGPRDPPEAKG